MSAQKNDKALIDWQDLPAAIGLLTRLPVPVDMDRAQARGAAAAWAYPLAGLVVALAQIVVAALCLWLGLTPAIAAAVVLLTAIVITGAMHEDGLADCADGFWGGWDRDRRLEIMKDSRIGAYGVIALILWLILRWSCLSVLLAGPGWAGALVAVAMVSRAGMVALMAALPHARPGGLSRSVGRPTARTAGLAALLALVGSLASLGLGALGFAVLMAGAAGLCGLIARAKIGGQTGDVLGATQQVGEVVLLISLAALAR